MIKRSIIWQSTKEELQVIINKSETYGQILSHFNLRNIGSNCKTLKKRLDYENIDYMRIKENRGRIGKRKPPAIIKTEDLLKENCQYARSCLKNRLMKEKLIPYKCAECGLDPVWNNKNLSLVLDHINGIHNDNRINNLRFLCPNCNSQTSTFAGKNNIRHDRVCHKYYCKCGKEVSNIKYRCSVCWNIEKRKVVRPSKEELEKMVWSQPTVTIAKQYNVSDKAVAKWCKTYNINKPPRGYWTKNESQAPRNQPSHQ